MGLPNWIFADVSAQIVNFLQNPVVTGLVVAGLALGLIPRVISILRHGAGLG